MLHFLNLLETFGVTNTNIRIIKEKGITTKNFKTDSVGRLEFKEWLETNKLSNKTIFGTFNQPYLESLSKKTLSDKDIEDRHFIMIDFDPIREKSTSSTKEEKEKALNIANNVCQFLKEHQFESLITCDSGNGYHILIPITPISATETTEDVGRFLKLLAEKFSTTEVEVDTTVKNPSRLTKVYGCFATKGESTEDRPHRKSSILTKNYSAVTNDFKLVSQLLEESDFQEKKQVTSKTFVRAYTKKWLDFYKIEYRIQQGDVPGMTLFILKNCPLAVHSNNQSGATIQQTADNKVRFSCLHESHSYLTIKDFQQKYPIPEEAFIQNSIESFHNERIDFNLESYTLKKDGLFKHTDKGSYKISEPLYIEKSRRIKETNESQYLLKYLSGSEWLEKWIGGEQLISNEFKKLNKFSVQIPPRAEADMIDFLIKQANQLSVEHYHNSIGWEGNSFLMNHAYSSTSEVNSTLDDSSLLDLEVNGTLGNWLDMVTNEVLGTDLELALSIGFSSVIIGKLSQTYPDLSTLFISIEGDSTTGKSSSQMFMTSLYGSYLSLMDTWNSTPYSILAKVERNNGVLYALDELGSCNQSNLTNLIYQLATGRSRLRLNKDAQLKETFRFSTTIVSSSEISLKDRTTSFQGIDARILPFRQIQWTKSAESSERIKKISHANRGCPAVYFVSRLMEISKYEKVIIDYYELAKDKLSTLFKQNQLKGRLIAQYAVILGTSYLINDIFPFELDILKIQENLNTSYLSAVNLSEFSDDLTYEEVLTNIFLEYKSSLLHKGNYLQNPNRFVGRFKEIKGQIKVNIAMADFEQSLKLYYPNSEVRYLIKKMIDRGLILTENGRNTKRIHISGTHFTTYEYMLSKEVLQFGNSQSLVMGTTNLQKISSININDLEDDELL
ncbi:DUF927 domain-containing protein [Vagococcus teuberi]|uniref:DUF927 domain-containing protein n=1 Tax=Vagococcus teuberi TaxID=519472 RepID=A0A1J0A3W3_9ENTE|nr:DUF927 domain-containing protein [Vagococcus teuberi]APB30614.1 hypothetical protein BHY08_01495 [Vagococcus teuberi]